MLWPTLILILLAAVLVLLGYRIVARADTEAKQLAGVLTLAGACVAAVFAVLWWNGVVTWKAFFA